MLANDKNVNTSVRNILLRYYFMITFLYRTTEPLKYTPLFKVMSKSSKNIAETIF